MIKKIKLQYFILPIMCLCVMSMFRIASVSAIDDYSGSSSTSSSLAGTGSSSTGGSFTNPISFTTVDGLLSNILTTIQSIVAILAVVMIVVGGILYITSGGDQGRVTLAKTAVTAAIIGLAIAVAAPTFLFEIYDILGGTQPAAASGAKSLSVILFDLLQVLLGIIGTLSVLMLVVGGIMYMTSGGDSTRADTARKTIQYAIIGLIVAILSLVIVSQIINVL